MSEYGKVYAYVTITYIGDRISEVENMDDAVHEALRDAAIEPDRPVEIELEYGSEIEE